MTRILVTGAAGFIGANVLYELGQRSGVTAIGWVRPTTVTRGLHNHVDEQRFPCSYYWRGKPEIGANLHPTSFSIFRPLVRGGLVDLGR